MFVPIQVDENSTEPMYAQIENQLRALILSGRVETGTLLPSIREFASQLQCSIITVRRVYQDLENEGLLRTKQGTGTFVAEVEQGEKDQYREKAVEDALRIAVQAALQMKLRKQEFKELVDRVIQENWSDEGGGER
ncbi:GntR family transcriptional regulator [Paenibacillus aquistagni]|uniref:Transcriptional regulator, GntR family n=1 Tax=Paenibacillus aquistagni TaxID=1852522 RepID=A0A1X7LA37_9BACL|nr:GntR family transcriptional regulator [Paenibacillus aquistagni]SMG50708.1 transcriptional regulator, GntR family [Paenibacillus aquistagni]